MLDDDAVVQVNDDILYPKAGDEIWMAANMKYRLSSAGTEFTSLPRNIEMVSLTDISAKPCSRQHGCNLVDTRICHTFSHASAWVLGVEIHPDSSRRF
jgi:hypothetical protein